MSEQTPVKIPLVESLKLLADENRMDLIKQLREPKIVDEILLTPSRVAKGSNPHRQLTRQAIRHHLRQLRDDGLVEVRSRRRADGRAVSEYVVNRERLFSVVEDLRKLNESVCRTDREASSLRDLGDRAGSNGAPGARLVLVHGLHRGRVFPLNASNAARPRGWVLGRHPEAHVRLDYDPSIPYENTEIVDRDGTFHVVDLRSSTQGTVLNGHRLPFGGEAPVRHGDIIEIGASALVFQNEQRPHPLGPMAQQRTHAVAPSLEPDTGPQGVQHAQEARNAQEARETGGGPSSQPPTPATAPT